MVSAMGKSTDDLLRLANEVSSTQPPRELDMLLTTGERISMALLCMALADLGIPAASFTGSQAGIMTSDEHTKAKITEIRPDRLFEALDQGFVPVVAGFQGMSADRNITSCAIGAQAAEGWVRRDARDGGHWWPSAHAAFRRVRPEPPRPPPRPVELHLGARNVDR